MQRLVKQHTSELQELQHFPCYFHVSLSLLFLGNVTPYRRQRKALETVDYLTTIWPLASLVLAVGFLKCGQGV